MEFSEPIQAEKKQLSNQNLRVSIKWRL